MWKQDWFFALIISLVFFIFAAHPFIMRLEWAIYDLGVRLSQSDPGEKIAVIAIDDESIANIGRWPWPRDVLANMIDKLKTGGAKVIGNTILLSEPQVSPGLEKINNALAFIDKEKQDSGNLKILDDIKALLSRYRIELDTDTLLAKSIGESGNVVMSTLFSMSTQGYPLGKTDKPLPDYLKRNTIELYGGDSTKGSPAPAQEIYPPIALFGEAASGIGHLNLMFNQDGAVRLEQLAIDYYGDVFPSLSLLVAAKSLNLGPEDIKVLPGSSINLGNLNIKTDPYSRMYPFFYQSSQGGSAFTEDSFYDVFQDKIPASKYKDKIVLIGATAAGVGTQLITPLAEPMQPAMFLAHTTASILNQDFFTVPDWAVFVEGRFGLAFLLVAIFLIVVLPRLNAGVAAISSLTLFFLLIGVSLILLTANSQWVQLMGPAFLLVCGYILLITKRFFVTERGKIKSEEESSESNRMLGLAFQQQGQLDMALEKFYKCPLDKSLMEPLYNLALDYESKRKFNKATSIYEYMARHDPKFRDIEKRVKQTRTMSETVILGGTGGAVSAGTLIMEGDGLKKSMLGRYEIEKELGKGAMGTVYLGKDPKINRIVAIKTMALSQEFEEKELAEVKSRFFREAETAGRLSHPNIVSIYDAGEEHDLAYIAMEFLEGHDLTAYTEKGNLFPAPKVLNIIATAADALDYAHKQNVVHRDIKPANIMYNPDKDSIKITDFGIARITDVSKTKTGIILGTPSYMSPEQISGKKVDGQSDLFSLGVMLYEMLSGELPFKGDSMANLMFNIASEPHGNILKICPDFSNAIPLIGAILNKALQKKPENRFNSGSEMAKYLRKCIGSNTIN